MDDLIEKNLSEGLSYKMHNGHFVNARVQKICNAIKDYEPELDVMFIPPHMRREGQAAYRIIHRPVGAPPYILFTVRRDEDFDERILQRIIVNDQRNGKHDLTELEAYDFAQKLVEQQKFREKMDEANDIAKHVIKSHLNTYKVDDKITIRDRGGIF